LIARAIQLARKADLVYANTQKALVVGAIASWITRRPLIYHLHDILSSEHFSATNRRLAIALANRSALVIANSEASRTAFIEAGGHADFVQVVYNGFRPELYRNQNADLLREMLDLEGQFVVGQFSRLSPWKGQHVLLEALTHCSKDVTAVFVGDALFGETEYVKSLHRQVEALGLQHRVRFLGFRSDVVALMSVCDVVAHTSTAAEPFGRVIVEAMLCGKPAIATKAGGAVELVEHGMTGWLVAPGDPVDLAQTIEQIRSTPEESHAIAKAAQSQAEDRFALETINAQIKSLLVKALLHF
jgi:glycosyltransferase involved in cell wall biosynthesis